MGWCTTIIKIYSENKDKLAELNKLLNKWTSEDCFDNDLGEAWLGNIVIGAGFGTWKENGYIDTDLKCRGVLVLTELADDYLWIETETLWIPMLELWIRLLEKYLPDGKLIYYTEDFDSGLYCSNDPEYKDLYYVDSSGIDIIEELLGHDNEVTENNLRKCLQVLLDTSEDDIDTLIELVQTGEYEDDIYIVKGQYCEPEDFDDLDY